MKIRALNKRGKLATPVALDRDVVAKASAGQVRILEMIAAGAPLADTLGALVLLIEAHCPGMLGSVLLVGEDGRSMRHGAAPSLPTAFAQTVDGQPIGPRAGSCGTAIYRREPVVTEDIESDPLWDGYRTVALAHRLRACWATPIFDAERNVLGSFACYFRTPRKPTGRHVELIAVATHTAAIAIVKRRGERERERLVRDLGERVKELTVLHECSRLLQSAPSIEPALVESLARLLPTGQQFPADCEARVSFGGTTAQTAGWRETPWRLRAPIPGPDGDAGDIELAYLHEHPRADHGPFLEEERRLLDSVANMLATHLGRMLDGSARRKNNEELERFRAAMDASGDAILLVDRASLRYLDVNQTFCDMVGYSREEMLRMTPMDLFSADRETLEQDYDAIIADLDAAASRIEGQYRRKDGTVIPIETRRRALRTKGGWIIVGTARDISERKQAEERIRYLATHDELTGLPNRVLMQDRLAQAIAHARRVGRQVALMYIDLDRFKVINDGFGHPFGDAVLRAAGERLAALVRDGDTVARHGGDEFLILLSDLRRAADAYLVVQKIVDGLGQPIRLQGREVHLSGSIGVSVFPQDGQTADALIGNADVAMYRAKELGRNTYQFYTREMSDETLRRVDLENKLRGAAAAGQLRLVYQPKVSLKTGQITGCEALLRWQHPELGDVPPARFIPVAEDSGLIVPIGDWVLRTACAQGKAWLDAGLAAGPVAVNLSARQFLQQDVVAWVMDTLRETGLPPAQLELELTESLIAQDVEKVIGAVRQLKAAGVRLSIDDFGTGYSSLSYLKRFPVDTLKIDQSFVRDMLTDLDDATIVLAVVALGHNLKFKVAAEGVETAEHCRFLRLNRCDEIQGFHFSPPVHAQELEAMLRAGKRLA